MVVTSNRSRTTDYCTELYSVPVYLLPRSLAALARCYSTQYSLFELLAGEELKPRDGVALKKVPASTDIVTRYDSPKYLVFEIQ